MTQKEDACGMALEPSRKLYQEKSFCELERLDGGVYILKFTGEDQHRFTPASIQLIDELLDQVLRDKSACALITTNQGKFFSNGMDVKYLRQCDSQMAIEYLFMFQRLVSKLLTFCIPTIAVIRGHAVGAGCIFSLAHDYRLMISSRAYIFMNEVDLGLSLTPGNMALLCSKLPISVFQEAVLTGKRYDGTEAAAAGIVQVTCSSWPNLLREGTKKAMEYKSKNWKRVAYHGLKMEMFKTTVKELEDGGTGFARL
ncbi:hypothetical protein ACH5RR_037529 [Cinchona calisaya]|uniref:Delta(3)-Delta(2)-enoyl-CoA isomerase n=1 Tax=Cinchona calisaya TaxID=153742 RepID=A0ABD2YB74_9GENT